MLLCPDPDWLEECHPVCRQGQAAGMVTELADDIDQQCFLTTMLIKSIMLRMMVKNLFMVHSLSRPWTEEGKDSSWISGSSFRFNCTGATKIFYPVMFWTICLPVLVIVISFKYLNKRRLYLNCIQYNFSMWTCEGYIPVISSLVRFNICTD